MRRSVSARRSVSVHVREEEATKKDRKKMSKQLRATQEMLQSISKTVNMSSFLSNSPPDEVEHIIHCPRCRYKMNRTEVTNGFNTGVLDYTTECTDCRHRFHTVDMIKNLECHFVWLCPKQTKDQFNLWKKNRDFEEDDDICQLLAEDRPEIVFNAYKYADVEKFKTVKEAVEDWLEI